MLAARESAAIVGGGTAIGRAAAEALASSERQLRYLQHFYGTLRRKVQAVTTSGISMSEDKLWRWITC